MGKKKDGKEGKGGRPDTGSVDPFLPSGVAAELSDLHNEIAQDALELACGIGWSCVEMNLIDRGTGHKMPTRGVVLGITSRPSGSVDEVTHGFFVDQNDLAALFGIVAQATYHMQTSHPTEGA